MLVIGRHGQLAQSLAERGGEGVTMLCRPELDLAVPGSASAAIRAASADIIVNAAAFTAVDLAETEKHAANRINADAAGEIAFAARELGVPLIHISTDYVFDGSATAPIDENAQTDPIGAYGRSKLAGEIAVRAGTGDHIILRTSWLVSPFGKNFVRTMVDLGQQRDTLSVVGGQYGNPTSALDLADAILAIAAKLQAGAQTGLGQTYHVAGTGIASWFDVAVAVQDELARFGRKSAAVTSINTADWPTPARRPVYSALNCSKFARDFGVVMPDWRASLRPIVERLVA